MRWTGAEDNRLRTMFGKSDPKVLEREFKRKYAAIYFRAKSLGIAHGRQKKKAWSVESLELLFSLTKNMASPKELQMAFPGIEFSDILEEAKRSECDICYLINREQIRKSVDVIVDIDLTLNIRKLEVVT